jgi:hypothetical protein
MADRTQVWEIDRYKLVGVYGSGLVTALGSLLTSPTEKAGLVSSTHRLALVDGIQVHKVITVSESK